MNQMNDLKFKSKALFTLAAVALTLNACKKDSTERDYEKEIVGTKGIYILNEGAFGSNDNSTISYYDIEKKAVVSDFYKQVNGRNLGTDANDLQTYGSKLYCVVTGKKETASSFVDIMDISTGKTIKRISFNVKEKGKMPRSIAFYKNKAYVSSYDGTINSIDTANYSTQELILKNGTVTAEGLEGLMAANGKLYVAGSNHYAYPNSFKNKVVVIDLTSFAQTKLITVSDNPQKMVVAEDGNLLLACSGVYQTTDPAFQKININTDAVTATYNISVGPFSAYKNQVFTAIGYGSGVASLNIATGTVGANLVTDDTKFTNVYGLTINPFDQSVLVADAIDYSSAGKAFLIGADGKLKYSFATGVIPKIAAFNYRYAFVSKN